LPALATVDFVYEMQKVLVTVTPLGALSAAPP
jgi:hypothetical protein